MSFPTMLRTYFERAQELTPAGVVELSLLGRGVNGTYVQVTGANTLTFAGTPAYTIAGPPDPLASPIQLGFERGDLVLLTGQVGGESNDGKLVSLDDPAAGTIYDTLTVDSPENYFFSLIKRRTFVLTNRGREWLANLMAWRVIGESPTADEAYLDDRIRFLMLGSGNQAEIRDVETVNSPIILIAPSQKLINLSGEVREFRCTSFVRYGKGLAENRISLSGPTLVSEAALCSACNPKLSGSSASAFGISGDTIVSGLTGMRPYHVGYLLEITNGDNPSINRILRYIDENTVVTSRNTPVGPDSGNPSLSWLVGAYNWDDSTPCAAYVTFEGFVKTSGFAFRCDWEFRI